jgi:hypothetical protein
MTNTASTRRWHQFSLRTIFVVVTIVGCALGWLGSQVAIVHRRNEALSRLNATVLTDEEETLRWINNPPMWFKPQRGTTQEQWDKNIAARRAHKIPARLPFWRKWLGDNDGINSITLPVEATAADMEQIRTLFPEIHIWRRLRRVPPHEVYDSDYTIQKRS